MLGILLDQVAEKGRYKELVVRYSFYAFNGLLAGVFFNDIVRLLFGDFEFKHHYQYLLAAAVAGSGFVYPLFNDKNNNIFLGGGLALGQWWTHLSEKGKKIELI